MKQQLESLAEEMVKEIKDLKDLTKKELPEFSKEYIRYNMVISSVGIALFSLVLMAAIGCAIGAFFNVRDVRDCCTLLAALLGMVGMFGFFISLHTFLEFKFQPRRMAIKAITSLLTREN